MLKINPVNRRVSSKDFLLVLPIAGIVAFVALYILAALLYPGGSQTYPNAISYSWDHNFFCTLLNETAINGKPNTGQIFAIMSLFFLALSMTLFYWNFPKQFPLSTSLSRTIQYTGLISMILACLLFTKIDHDMITNLASLFGLMATLGTMMALYQHKKRFHFLFGLGNLLLVLLNNWCYYHADLIEYLPPIQKLSFASVLIWVIAINSTAYFTNTKKTN